MKKFFMTLMLVLGVLCVCACTDKPTPTETQPVTPATEIPVQNPVISDFKIIYPVKTLFSSAQPEELTRTIWNAIMQKYGVRIDYSDDKVDEESGYYEKRYEILIGNTGREESKSISEKDMKYYDYAIKCVNTKLVIKAGSDEALANAVDYFIETCINTGEAMTADGWERIMQTDYNYVYDSNIGKLFIDGVDISDFTVCKNVKDYVAERFAAEVLEKVGEKIEIPMFEAEREHEIIIGDCGREEYAEAIKGLKGNDYVIKVINGKLVIAGASEAATSLALYTFYSEYLGEKHETLNLTADNGYVYKREYPVRSITLCGYDINDYVIVADENSFIAAKILSRKIEEMCGISIEVMTELSGANAAIIIGGAVNESSKRVISSAENGKLVIKSEGSLIYLGTNSLSYGNSSAVNAFVRLILGYDIDSGIAAYEIVDVPEINTTADIDKYRNEFTVTHYFGIKPRLYTNEDGSLNTELLKMRIDEAAEAGMNVIEFTGSADAILQALEYCDERGDVKLTVLDWTVWSITSRIVSGEKLYDGWMDDVKNAVSRYKGYKSLYAYFVADEPNIQSDSNATEIFEGLRDLCAVIEETHPSSIQYINNIPMVPWIERWYPTLYEYFMETVNTGILSYDRYVFDDSKGRAEAPTEGYCDNLEFARNAALKYDAEYMIIALLVDHYRDVENGTKYRYLNESELSWQAFNALAYGVSAFSYFTYLSPDENESDYPWVYNPEGGAISADGKKTAHYYDIQKVNKRLKAMGDVLIDRQSLAVFHLKQQRIVDEQTGIDRLSGVKFEGYNSIEEIIAPDATIGFFEDNLMVIASKDFENSIDVEVKTGSKLLILDTETGEWNSLDSKSFSLEAGGAALIKIIE